MTHYLENLRRLDKARKQQTMSLAICAISAVSGGLQALGIFAEGVLPWYFDIAVSVGFLIFALVAANTIRKIRSEMKN